MISLLIALCVSQVQVIDQTGRNLGRVPTLECGTNTTCDIEHHGWVTLKAVASASDGGTIVLPTCGTGQVVTSDGGTLSCTNVIAGLPGGMPSNVQYNIDGGNFGGISNVNSDGTHLVITAETSLAGVPGAGKDTIQTWAPDTAFPGIPFQIDGAFGAIPLGILTNFGQGTAANTWTFYCARMPNYNVSPVGTNGTALTATQWNSFGGWTNAGLINRIPWVQTSQGGSANAVGSLIQPNKGPWRGNTAGAGGFLLWTRVALHLANLHTRYMFGLQATLGAFNNEPSVVTNTVYFGADNGASGQTTMHVCSNDTSGSATCTDLGSNYPTTTADAIYDLWLAAAPNSSTIEYYINRLDVANSTQGTISSDLPQNTVQLSFIAEVNVADGGVVGGSGATTYFNGMCLAYNY